jgi:hypothetical protein
MFRSKEEGRSSMGAPLVLPGLNCVVDVLEYVLCQERLLNVKGSRKEYDEVSDVLWLENLELNRLLGGKAMTETMWRCDQVRAGRLYNRMMFDTREEAEQFAQRMQQMEPDQMFSIEAIEAKQVWN